MKTTALQLEHSMNRASCPRALLLIPLALACFTLSPQARAVCQEGCDITKDNTFLGDDALANFLLIPAKAQTWNAARDLRINEKPDESDPHSTELSNPNGRVPEWSYGYRATLTDTALVLFRPQPISILMGLSPWIAKDKQSGLLMHIAATESVSLCVPMKG